MISRHTPVLLKEVMAVLNPQPGQFFIDGTYGAGGHSQEILKKIGSGGKLLAVDWSQEAARRCKTDFCVVDNFANLPEVLRKLNLPPADGLLLDLGFSSEQLQTFGRGFSFQKDEPLLMTYNDQQQPVRDLLKQVSEKELAEILWRYGEERKSRIIARAIKTALRKKPIRSSGDLVKVIEQVVKRSGKLHPATKTFLALRSYANQELENLKRLLAHLPEIITRGGRAAIISFHSLEDRQVKNHFRNLAAAGRAEIITKKPLVPSREEILQNPRSRSAKLRAIKFKK